MRDETSRLEGGIKALVQIGVLAHPPTLGYGCETPLVLGYPTKIHAFTHRLNIFVNETVTRMRYKGKTPLLEKEEIPFVARQK